MKKSKIIYDSSLKNDMTHQEKRLRELINGEAPKDKFEKALVKEIKEAKKNNKTIDIPSM